MNYVVLLAVSAGIAIALQVTVNAIGLRDLGTGGLIGVSGLATAAVGFLATLFAQRPEYTGKALLCALISGVLGAFILGSIALAAGYGGVATRVENTEPYALFGDNGGDLRVGLELEGQHLIRFDFYDADAANGTVVGTESFAFFVV